MSALGDISEYISIAEFAKLHGVTPDSVRQKIARGTLPEAVKIGRNWVVPADAKYKYKKTNKSK